MLKNEDAKQNMDPISEQGINNNRVNNMKGDRTHFEEEAAQFLPKIYARDYSIRIDAGMENFCAFIDLEPPQFFTVAYRVYSYLSF